jgi:topoisomerase-4 subunit A
MPEDDALYVIASDAGYGFVVKGEDLQAKNKAGKALLSLPNNAKVIAPRPVADREQNWLASVTTEGRLLIFKISDLPQLGRARATRSSVFPASVWPVAKNMSRTSPYWKAHPGAAGRQTHPVAEGRRPRALQGERGRRGNKLPRASSGWMRCSSKTSIRRKR